MRGWAGLFLLAAIALCEPALGAEDGDARSGLAAAMQAVQRGAYDEAIGGLELLADRGFVHADASLARAYAYVERARSRANQPGDLGRAVAALEEVRRLRPGDAQAEHAIEALRAEIGRRRARTGNSPLVQRPSLGRAVVGILSENVWALLAALGSTILTAGLLLRRLVRQRGGEIAGAVGIVLGLLLTLVAGVFLAQARHYRTSSVAAVIVAPEARLLDESGRPLPASARAEAIPEGALVYVHEQREARSHVEWGGVSGWVLSAQLRRLALPAQGG